MDAKRFQKPIPDERTGPLGIVRTDRNTGVFCRLHMQNTPTSYLYYRKLQIPKKVWHNETNTPQDDVQPRNQVGLKIGKQGAKVRLASIFFHHRFAGI